uniref:Uncharacterized protein n=1 Tax=Arundo donax TaxID=35708 RepID=A0A0A8Z407_ARUDO
MTTTFLFSLKRPSRRSTTSLRALLPKFLPQSLN